MADSSHGPSTEKKDLTFSILPTEIMFAIFGFVPPKDIVRCRLVSTKWRQIIDVMLQDDNIWEQFCKYDYKNIYEKAKWKTPNISSWFEMYRSLSLWTQLHTSKENIIEFALSDTIDDELRNATTQEKGITLVHKRSKIVFHDILSCSYVRRQGFSGQYVSLQELEDVVVMLGLNGRLHIVNKPTHNWQADLQLNTYEDDEICFDDVKSFIIGDRTVFYLTYRQHLFSFHLDHDKTANKIILPERLSEAIPDRLGALGYVNHNLHILTMTGNMYMYIDKQVHLKFSVSTITNMMDCLYKHNMLENLDFRNYYVLLDKFEHKQPDGDLRYITKMHAYGDIHLIGTQDAKVFMYYKPFVDGQLDLTESQPIKEYNFSKRIEHPILSLYPILNFDITELIDGHKLLICMPRKILSILYTHEYLSPTPSREGENEIDEPLPACCG